MDKTEFKQAMKENLGLGAVKIHITDEQIENALIKAKKFFFKHADDATEKVYYKYQIQQADVDLGTNTIELADYVYDVIRFYPVRRSFIGDYEYNMYANLSNSMFTLPIIGSDVGYYYETMQYFSLIRSTFNKSTRFKYNRYTNKIQFDISIGKDVSVGEWLLFEVETLVDPDVFEELYEDPSFLALATEYARYTQATILTKYSGMSLPGGPKFNFETMLKEANENIKNLEKEIKNYYSPACPILLL